MNRSYFPAPPTQPSRRVLVLVYLACIAVPLAVAVSAYLLREALQEPASTPPAQTARVTPARPDTPSVDARTPASPFPSAEAAGLGNPTISPPRP